MISGAFSLTWQAVQLGLLPRVRVIHTSEGEIGQIYIPLVNQGLLVATVALVLGFKTSSNLAAAYGVAVTGTMVITTILAFTVMRQLWGWSLPLAAALTGFFLAIDGAFLAANLVKVADGGWFPLLVGAGGVLLVTTWRTGRRLLVERLREQPMSLEELKQRVAAARPARVPGTVIYMTGHPDLIPAALRRLLRVFNALHEHVVFLTVLAERVPRVEAGDRLEVQPLGLGFFRVTVRYGFCEQPNVLRAVSQCREAGTGDRPERRHLHPQPRDADRLTAPGHGTVAGEAVRIHGQKRRSGDRILSNPARSGARGRRPDRAVSPRCGQAPQATGDQDRPASGGVPWQAWPFAISP